MLKKWAAGGGEDCFKLSSLFSRDISNRLVSTFSTLLAAWGAAEWTWAEVGIGLLGGRAPRHANLLPGSPIGEGVWLEEKGVRAATVRERKWATQPSVEPIATFSPFIPAGETDGLFVWICGSLSDEGLLEMERVEGNSLPSFRLPSFLQRSSVTWMCLCLPPVSPLKGLRLVCCLEGRVSVCCHLAVPRNVRISEKSERCTE